LVEKAKKPEEAERGIIYAALTRFFPPRALNRMNDWIIRGHRFREAA
jgi:hypothetical protein